MFLDHLPSLFSLGSWSCSFQYGEVALQKSLVMNDTNTQKVFGSEPGAGTPADMGDEEVKLYPAERCSVQALYPFLSLTAVLSDPSRFSHPRESNIWRDCKK